GKRSRRRDNPEAAAAEAMLGELTREYYTCNRLSDLLRLHPDDLHEKGGVVAGASVLTEAGGNLRLRGRPAEALAPGDGVLGWRCGAGLALGPAGLSRADGRVRPLPAGATGARGNPDGPLEGCRRAAPAGPNLHLEQGGVARLPDARHLRTRRGRAPPVAQDGS